VKKLIMALVLAAACHSSTTTTTSTPARVVRGNQTGAADPESAIQGFMTAVKQQDLQAMGALWGDADGLARDREDRTTVERRELIMMCWLKHDKYTILGDAPNPGGTRAYAVSLTSGQLTRSTTFDVVKGPSGRWYVKSFDTTKLQEICAQRG
jgi:hypothetical protein